MQPPSPLSQYIQTGSRSALDQLIRQHVDFVYATAARQLGDAHQAQDVTQAVFIVLARRAKSVKRESALPGWLFKTTRYAALNLIKMEQRRRKHEQAAAAQKPEAVMPNSSPQIDSLIPVLNEAIAKLSASDRDAILLRYLQGNDIVAVSTKLAITEYAARKRVGRAVERLRHEFAKRGITIESTAVATTLTAAAAQAAPIGVADAAFAAASGAAPSASAATIAHGLYQMFLWAQAKLIATIAIAAMILIASTAAVLTPAKPQIATTPQAAAPPATQPDQNNSFTVTCVDSTGKPISAAQIYLSQSLTKSINEKDTVITTIGPLTADATGAAHFPNLPALQSTDREMRRVIYARLPGKLVGFDSQYWFKGGEKFPPQNLSLILTASTTLHGKLTALPGLKPDSAFIQTPILWSNESNGQPFWRTSHPTDNLPPNTYDVPVNPDGTFTITDFPAQGHATLTANAPELAEAEQDVSTAHLPDIQMRPQSVIHGRVTAPDGSPVANVSIQATATIGSDLIYRHPFVTTTDADGRYTIDRLPNCYLGLIVSAPNLVLPVQPINLETGQTIEKNLTLQTGVLVTGRASDPQGNPLPGVELGGCSPASLHTDVSKAITDSAGRYTIRMPIGQDSIYVFGTPDGFDNPKQSDREKSITIPENVTTMVGPNWRIPLAKPATPYTTATLTGRVVDEHGNGVPNLPIQDATVEGPDDPIQVYPEVATTDSTGRYSAKVTGQVPNQLYPVSDDFDSPKTRAVTPKPNEAITFKDLIVHPRPMLGTISGVVTDPQNHPLENAEVIITGSHGRPATDSQGRFTVPVRAAQSMLLLGKSGYKPRNWNDIPPDTHDLHLTLYPAPETGLDYNARHELPKLDALLNHPAPPLHVDWILSPPNQAPTLTRTDGRMTVLAFDWDNSASAAKFATDLTKLCATADAVPMIIFTPQATPPGVRALFPDHAPNIFLGIDQYFANANPNDPDGSTYFAYGATKKRTIYVISPDGTIIYTQQGLKGLESHLLN